MSVSSPLMRKLSSASKLPLTAEAVRVAAVSKRWQPNLQGRMFFCMLMSSKLSLFFTNFHLTLFVSHYHIVVTLILIYWYWLLWMKLVLVCFSFLLTSWPCTKCQCQTKTGRKSSSISCLASLHPSTPLFLLLLWNTDTLTSHRVMNCWWHNGSVWFLVDAEVAVFIRDLFKSAWNYLVVLWENLL